MVAASIQNRNSVLYFLIFCFHGDRHNYCIYPSNIDSSTCWDAKIAATLDSSEAVLKFGFSGILWQIVTKWIELTFKTGAILARVTLCQNGSGSCKNKVVLTLLNYLILWDPDPFWHSVTPAKVAPVLCDGIVIKFNPSVPHFLIVAKTSLPKCSALYWSNPPFLIFWHSGTVALRTERQSARMSEN